MNSFRIRQSKGSIVEGEVGVGADVAQHYVERTCKVLRQSKQQVARVAVSIPQARVLRK